MARLVTVALVVLAISSVTAIASATLFRRLPFPSPDGLVQIYSLGPDTRDPADAMPLVPVLFNHLDARGPSLEAVAGIWVLDRALSGGGEPESVSAGRVSASFFPMLGASMAAGRTFTEEEVANDAALAVLSQQLWTRMFAANPAIIGTTVNIDRRPHTVIGVTTRDFDPAFTATELWTPLLVREPGAVRATVVQTIGRLRKGATPAAASGDLQPVLKLGLDEMPDLLKGQTMGAADLRQSRYGSRRGALLMMIVVVAALGLLATANLANLTFADLSSRRGDITLRSALGGSARSIVAAEVVPCVVLAFAGAALGQVAAATAAPWMLSLDPSLAATGLEIRVDWRVALAGLCAALAVMAAAVAIPTWRMARLSAMAGVAGSRLTDGRGLRVRAWLVGAQAAIALVLLSAATLVVTTLQRNAAADPGFDPSQVITGQLRLSDNAFPDHQARVRFIHAVLERLRQTPGIVAAGTTLNRFSSAGTFTTNMTVEDAPHPEGLAYSTQYRRVSPGYFETMRIQVARGRTFLPSDTDATPLVAVISEALARRYWPGSDPIGRRIRRGASTQPWSEIIGVVADVRDAGLGQDNEPVMYTSYYQGSTSATPAGLVVRTMGDPRTSIRQVKQAVWEIDPAQPLSNIVVLEDYLAASLGPQQFRAWLVGLCGLFGTMLATVGIYGVTSRSVSERTKEVGIRLALGERPSRIWRRLVASSVRAVLMGGVSGAVLSFVFDSSIVRLLPELGSGDWTYRVGAAALMTSVAGTSAALAARRAASIEPLRALRGD